MRSLTRFGYDDLMPEQRDVIDFVTSPGKKNITFVQGVAGSGKTTIALNIAERIADKNNYLSSQNKFTILFLTYNDRLIEYCSNTLKENPDIVNLVNDTCDIQEGKLNVITVKNLFAQVLTDNDRKKILSDEKCVAEIGVRAANMQLYNLLPSQIFTLITTVLRGRRELVNLGVDSLQTIIQELMASSSFYRVYGESLQHIRQWFLNSYENWKGDGIDRADIAARFRNIQEGYANHLSILASAEIKNIREAIIRNFSLAAPLDYALIWLFGTLSKYTNEAEISERVNIYERKLGSRISWDDWQKLLKDIYQWIDLYGLKADPLWDSIIKKVTNPVIIVDEVQDLSPIELNNLIELWFQIGKNPESHLILLGDMNQQITPTGFKWEYVDVLITKYGSSYQSNRIIHNDYSLTYNYRTTEEIARAVHSMAIQIAPKWLESNEADRFIANSIDPIYTHPIKLSEDIDKVKDEHGESGLIPNLLVGEASIFTDAIITYLDELARKNQTEDEYLSTVIITEHPEQIEPKIRKELNRLGLRPDLIEIVPVLSCKGLEFKRCIVLGISTKKAGVVEPDLISQWYTSFTRAKLILLIYLTQSDFDYLQEAGCKEFSPDEVIVRYPIQNPEDVLQSIKLVAKSEPDAEVRYQWGGKYLALFVTNPNKEDLEASIRNYLLADSPSGVKDAAHKGARWYEDQRKYLQAADYYDMAEDYLGEIRCLEKNRTILVENGGDFQEISDLRAKGLAIVEKVPEIEGRADCWLLFGEYEKALQTIAGSVNVVNNKITDSIIEKVIIQISEGNRNSAFQLAELLEKYQLWLPASTAWLALEDWSQALRCASEAGPDDLIKLSETLVHKIKDQVKGKNRQQAITMVSLLEQYQQLSFAAEARLLLHYYMEAIDDFLQINNVPGINRAIEVVQHLDEGQKIIAYSKIGYAFQKLGPEYWPDSYSYFYLGKNQEELRYMESRCRQENKNFPILVKCYLKIGNEENAVGLANSLQGEWAALCWEEIGASYLSESAKAWMQVYTREVKNVVELIGPDQTKSEISPEEFAWYRNHIDKNHEKYNLSSDEWDRVNRAIVSGDREIRNNILFFANVVLKSKDWVTDFLKLVEQLRKLIKNTAIINLADVKFPSIPKEPVDEVKLNQLWNDFNQILIIFQSRAKDKANQLFRISGNELKGIEVMYYVCRMPKEAENLANNLWRSGSYELWTKSWIILNWQFNKVNDSLSQLDQVKYSDLILKSINTIFKKDQKSRDRALKYYKQRLIDLDTPKTHKILAHKFGFKPIINQPKKSGKQIGTQSEIQGAAVSIIKLLEDLVLELNKSNLQKPLYEEISDQVNVIRSHISHTEKGQSYSASVERLPLKIKSLLALIPIDSNIKTLTDCLQDQTSQLVELVTKSLQPSTTSENKSTEQDIERSTKDVVLQRSHADEQLKNSTKTPRRRRKHKKESNEPKYIIRNYHSKGSDTYYSRPDVLNDLDVDIANAIKDSSIKILLVIHGPDKIKDDVRKRFAKLKHHNRVEAVFPGEKIEKFSNEWKLILDRCPSFPIAELGSNNTGLTVVIFK